MTYEDFVGLKALESLPAEAQESSMNQESSEPHDEDENTEGEKPLVSMPDSEEEERAVKKQEEEKPEAGQTYYTGDQLNLL